jgi:hypothetical protein
MTEAQLRHLTVTMRRLEEALAEIESGLRGKQPEEILTAYEDDIPTSLKPAVLKRIRCLREELRGAKQHFQLNVEGVSNRRRFATKLSLLSIDLEGATSRYMAGYGELSDEERAPLDNRINRMIDMIDELRAMIGSLRLVPDKPPGRVRAAGE